MDNYSNCDQMSELLDAYHDHELADDERILVEQHVSQCAVCDSKLADIARLVLDLRAMPRLMPARDIVDSIDFDKLIAHSTMSSSEVLSQVTPSAKPTQPAVTTSSEGQSDRIATVVPASGKVVQMRSRYFGGVLAGAVAVAALAFAVVLNKPSTEPAGVALAPASRPAAVAQSPAQDAPSQTGPAVVATNNGQSSLPKHIATVEQPSSSSAVANRNSAESVVAVKPPNNQSGSTAETPLIASSAVDSGMARAVGTAAVVGGNTQIATAYNDADSSIEIAALGEGDDMTDSLGVATDEDGLYEIKI